MQTTTNHRPVRFFLILLATLATTTLMAQNFEEQWQAVNTYSAEGRYRTALEQTEAIYQAALGANQADQQAKAILYRTAFLRQLEEDGTEAAILQLRSDLLANQEPAVAPILHLHLAKGYRAYLQQRFRQLRDQTDVLQETEESATELDELPLAEWSMLQLVRNVVEQLTLSLESARRQRTPLLQMSAIIVPGENLPDSRPSVYDLLVYEAFNELEQSVRMLPDPVDPFRIDAEVAFAPTNEFIAYEPTTSDTFDVNYRRLLIYQDLLDFRREIARADMRMIPALVDAELSRLRWAHNATNDSRAYYDALERLFDERRSATNGGDIALELSNLINGNEEFWGATEEEQRLRLSRDRERYLVIIAAYPNTQAAQAAWQRLDQIEQQALRAQTDEVAVPDHPVLVSVSYRNLTSLHYRLVKVPYELEEIRRTGVSQQEIIEEFRRLPAVQSGVFTLAENDDYQEHRTEFALEGLDPGKYVLLVSDVADFQLSAGIVGHHSFVVSQLAILQLPAENGGKELQIVDRYSGQPLSGVTVERYSIQGYNRETRYRLQQTRQTDAEGRASFNGRDRRHIYVLSRGQDRLHYNLRETYRNTNRDSYERALIFTDRSIYRPGQRMHAKVLVISYDRDGTPSLATNYKLKLQLLDANYEQLEEVEVTTDAYGAVSVDLRLPEGRLNGGWRLRADGLGETGFRVEAYKRPKFAIEFPAPEEAVELGSSVTVSGKAVGYAGPAVANGRVVYRVERQISYWSYDFFGRGSGRTTAILAQGETSTDEQGNFSIEFVADPGETNGAAYRRPFYQYLVFVDVSDATGETHAAETYVPVRQRFLRLQVNMPDEADVQDEIALNLGLPSGFEEAVDVRLSLEPVNHPDPSLLDRKWPAPDRPLMDQASFKRLFPDFSFGATPALEDWTSAGPTVYNQTIAVSGDTSLTLPIYALTAGHFRMRISYTDLQGATQTIYQPLALFDLNRGLLPAGMLQQKKQSNGLHRIGEEVSMQLVNAFSGVHAMGGWTNRSESIVLEKVSLGTNWQDRITLTEADRGGRTYFLQYIYRNRYYQHVFSFNVPWRNKELQIEYETFRDKLRPGEEETWTLRISDYEGNPVNAQMLAAMYDASLDAILPHNWSINGLYPRLQWWPYFGNNATFGSQQGYGRTERRPNRESRSYSYPRFNFGLLNWDYGGGRVMRSRMMSYDAEASEQYLMVTEAAPGAPPPPPPPQAFSDEGGETRMANYSAADDDELSKGLSTETNAALNIRTNLSETAFFQPEILTDADGRASIRFTSPEALTSWKLQVLAHTQELAYALSSQEIVTQKELMIIPNAPRFLREGDKIEFSAKVSNLSDQVLTGNAELELFELASGNSNELDYSTDGEQAFRIEAGGSQVVRWSLTIPDGAAQQGEIGYRVIARSGEFSDGEQSRMPILTNRIFLTSTESFYLRGRDRKTVMLDALANASSSSLRHEGFSFELTSNPAWLAVKSLPYLTEYPYNCSEQLVNRFFANQLSYYIVSSKPKLREVFEQWKGDPEALASELAQNQDLKNALLEETPWMREAESEAEQRQRLGLLFDLNAVADRQTSTLAELRQRQAGNGSFSWFPDGRPNRYITAYVVESLVRLQLLNVLEGQVANQVEDIINRATGYLDNEAAQAFNRWLNRRELTDSLKATYSPSSIDIHFVYLRSGYLRKSPIPNNLQTPWEVITERLKTTWVERGLYEQALICSAFGRMDDPANAARIITSLRERALQSDELGMYWKYGEGYRWYELPIETHTRLQEAFLYNGGTIEELEEMRLWLLQHKRTNRWSSTKSTAAAIFALLQHDNDWLSDNNEVQVRFPNAPEAIWQAPLAEAQSAQEAGTGYYRMQLPATFVSPSLATVELRNRGRSISWGAMYWQFTEDIDRVVADNEGPLGLDRRVFRMVNTDAGERLEAINEETELRTGDRLRVQLIVRSDREMDFVHLKDRRAASLEPTEQLSGYRYTSGLGYYFSPDDLAVHFFIDQLPRGTFTLEYDLFVSQEGDFSNGLSQIQCMYAPELVAYTSGGRLNVE